MGWSRTAGDRYADARLAGKEDGPFTTDGWRCSIIRRNKHVAATHSPVCLAPAAPSHLQGTASHPRGSLHRTQTRAGPGEGQQAVCEEDVTQPQLGSQGLTAELLSPACKHIPTLSLVAPAPE